MDQLSFKSPMYIEKDGNKMDFSFLSKPNFIHNDVNLWYQREFPMYQGN